jgi:hypothetical protein
VIAYKRNLSVYPVHGAAVNWRWTGCAQLILLYHQVKNRRKTWNCYCYIEIVIRELPRISFYTRYEIYIKNSTKGSKAWFSSMWL